MGQELAFNPFLRTGMPAVRAYCDHPGDAVAVSSSSSTSSSSTSNSSTSTGSSSSSRVVVELEWAIAPGQLPRFAASAQESQLESPHHEGLLPYLLPPYHP